MKHIVLVTGGFDPLHSGHIAYFKEAKTLGDELWVGVNSDEWLTNKKGRPFMSFNERVNIIENLSVVDNVIGFADDEFGGTTHAIQHILDTTDAVVIVANGGDRTPGTIPEQTVFEQHPRVKFVFEVGGSDKKNSSSWILKEWSQPTVERAWGKYTVLDKGNGWQVKQLAFDVGKSLSDQRHFYRSEHWHVVEGFVKMYLEYPNGDISVQTYTSGDSIDIPVGVWHKAVNVGDITAKVIEVWLGDKLMESDIERRD